MRRADVADQEPEIIQYGEHPEQYFQLRTQQFGSDNHRGTVALIHGGYWRGEFSCALMDPAAEDLHQRGWTVANLEYRRVSAGGGWPLPLRDTVQMCQLLHERISRGELPGPLVLLGHSAGGQLALLATAEVRPRLIQGVLALAPITDVIETWREGLGEDAARELLAVSPGDPMHIAEDASPVYRLPVGVPISIIHGADDARVPIEHSRRYTSEARAAGEEIELIEWPSLAHRDAIDPQGNHWPALLQSLEHLVSARTPTTATGANSQESPRP